MAHKEVPPEIKQLREEVVLRLRVAGLKEDSYLNHGGWTDYIGDDYNSVEIHFMNSDLRASQCRVQYAGDLLRARGVLDEEYNTEPDVSPGGYLVLRVLGRR